MTVVGRAEAERCWDRHIPHYDLAGNMLPRFEAPWEELVWFARAFDGSIVEPTATGVRELAWEWRKRFVADGALPEGLTMLRAVLHGEQRLDYWGDEPGRPEPDALRHSHALVEAIRAVVEGGAHVSPDGSTVGGIRDKVVNAFDRLLVGYAAWGGHRYHGWTSYENQHNYLGPVIWSERDCDLRFAFELEREWPQAVHMEFAIGKASRSDYDKSVEGFQRVDVAVSDLSAFAEDGTSFERFRSYRHEAFFEVKWFLKGWGDNRDAKNRLADIPVDVAKLANHARLGRCVVAAMLVVDDEDYFHRHGSTDDWPEDVWRLYVGPSALEGRKLIPTAP